MTTVRLSSHVASPLCVATAELSESFSRGQYGTVVSGQLLLRRRGSRSVGTAERDGLLPLPIVPILVGGAGERIHAVATSGGESGQGRATHRHLPQDLVEPSAVLPAMRRPSHDAPSSAGDDRRLCSDDSRSSLRAAVARELCGDGTA